jgi:hypothetical protein
LFEGLILDHSGSSESVKTFMGDLSSGTGDWWIEWLWWYVQSWYRFIEKSYSRPTISSSRRASGMSINPDDINARLIYSAYSIAKTAEAIVGLNQKLDVLEAYRAGSKRCHIFSRV